MKYITALCCCLFSSFILTAQVATVKDMQSGEVLEEVAFIKYNPKAFAVTNKNGQADLSPFVGADRIEILMMGYQKVVSSFDSLASIGFNIQLLPLAFSLDEVVVSSSRFAQNAKDIPFKITTISLHDAQLSASQTAADLLASSGEVFVQKSQMGGGSPMIRGFSTNRLLYSIDGVRMNTAIFRSGNLQNVISLDPFAIAHSEVLFGPSSVIYGSDAIGGVMSFHTLQPKLSLTDDIDISGSAITRMSSANNELSAHFDLNMGWDKWAAVTSISSTKYGDLTMGTYGPAEYLRPFYVERVDNKDVIVANANPKIQNPTGYSQLNMMQKIRFQPNKKWNLEYGFHYSETSDYARYDRHIRYKNGLPRYGEWNYGPQKWMMNLLTISNQGSSRLYDDLNLKLAYQFFEESRISRDFNDDIRETKIEQVNAYSANLDFEKSMGRRNEFFYGVEAVFNMVNSAAINTNILSGTNLAAAPRYPSSNWGSYAAYLTNQFKVNEKILFSAGVRYNQYELNADFNSDFYAFPFNSVNTSKGAVTGSLGSVYEVNKKMTLSANLATGFRSPNIDDLGKVFDSAPGLVVVPNVSLEAETAYNADLSLTKVFGSRLKVDMTAFYTYLNNAMLRRDFQLNGADSMLYAGELSRIQAIQNAAYAQVYGIQAGLDLKLGAGFSVVSKINFQKGVEETDDGLITPARHAAPVFGSTKLLYKLGDLSFDFGAIYVGERTYENMPVTEIEKPYLYASDTNGKPYAPGWYTINFKAMYKMNNYLTVNAGIENITDQLYRSYSSGVAGAGRNFILSLKGTF